MKLVVTIPKSWREGVCRILDGTSGGSVLITPEVLFRWRATFPEIPVTVTSLKAMVAEALRDESIKGAKITDMKVRGGMPDSGEVYEFLFTVDEKQKAYAKISLRLRHNSVFFYSAHKSERDYL